MSHELRTPLNVILSTSKVTELKINNNDYDNKYLLEKLEQINKNSNRLLKLVNNLIDITKFELGSYELKLENLNIVEVVENIVLASVDYSTCKYIDLIFDTEEEEIITAVSYTHLDVYKRQIYKLNLHFKQRIYPKCFANTLLKAVARIYRWRYEQSEF